MLYALAPLSGYRLSGRLRPRVEGGYMFLGKTLQTALILTLLLVGCGERSGVERGAVSGEVTLDGAPVPEGAITFFPTSGNEGPASGGNIQDGHYDIARADGPVVGPNRVEIKAPRKTGKKIRSPDPIAAGGMMDEWKESVPARYNTKSTLEEKIESGKNKLDFTLQSQ